MGIKNIILSIAIIILTISAVVYGVHTFYERPEYEDYCPDYVTHTTYNNSVECEAAGGKWVILEDLSERETFQGLCNLHYYCSEEYEADREIFARNIFLIVLPLGIIIVIASAVIFGLEVVGAGLMGGGVGVVLYGIMEYWRYSANLLRFSLSLVGLVAIIWFTYWLNKRKK